MQNGLSVDIALFKSAAHISMAMIASKGEICQGFVRIEGRSRVP